MQRGNPNDLNPSQDLTDAGKFDLIRDTKPTVNGGYNPGGYNAGGYNPGGYSASGYNRSQHGQGTSGSYDPGSGNKVTGAGRSNYGPGAGQRSYDPGSGNNVAGAGRSNYGPDAGSYGAGTGPRNYDPGSGNYVAGAGAGRSNYGPAAGSYVAGNSVAGAGRSNYGPAAGSYVAGSYGAGNYGAGQNNYGPGAGSYGAGSYGAGQNNYGSGAGNYRAGNIGTGNMNQGRMNPMGVNRSGSLWDPESRFSLGAALGFRSLSQQNTNSTGGYGLQGFGQIGSNVNQPSMRTSQGIHATIQEMEKLRKSVVSRTVIGATVPFIIFAVIIFAPRGLPSQGMIFLLALLASVASLLIIGSSTNKKKQLKSLYKEVFVIDMLKDQFSDVFYDWQQGLDSLFVKSTGLVRLGNRYHSEDFIAATYRGVRFQQADVTVKYHTSSGKNSHTTIYFQGRVFTFDYSRKQSMAVQIFSKDFRYFGNPENGLKLSKVEMEDVNFNKQFTVQAMNPHDAFYILTPQFMQRLLVLKQRYSSITMVISQGKLHIGLNHQADSFDMNVWNKIDYPKEKERMEKDAWVIRELVEMLNCLP